MTDREMLEWAAKAAGIDGVWNCGFDGQFQGFFAFLENGSLGSEWNPLLDDGAALCLATKLRIEYIFLNDSQLIQCSVAEHTGLGDWETFLCDEPIGADVYASMRRAIVRAAAELGKMGEQG
ncbi:hypothetical protein [Burkholderia sp. BCC0405]|uniref:hypothetical protein n=1 Tax=Burkholderia sp. BCC0405 TaxID=2676298 RepID=UPI00158E8BE2|nr:hypothetical protein [Burkholderia sp. BCC0405]